MRRRRHGDHPPDPTDLRDALLEGFGPGFIGVLHAQHLGRGGVVDKMHLQHGDVLLRYLRYHHDRTSKLVSNKGIFY